MQVFGLFHIRCTPCSNASKGCQPERAVSPWFLLFQGKDYFPAWFLGEGPGAGCVDASLWLLPALLISKCVCGPLWVPCSLSQAGSTAAPTPRHPGDLGCDSLSWPPRSQPGAGTQGPAHCLQCPKGSLSLQFFSRDIPLTAACRKPLPAVSDSHAVPFGAVAHFRDSVFPSRRETSPGGTRREVPQGEHSLASPANCWSVCLVSKAPGPSLVSVCSLLSSPQPLSLWVISPLLPSLLTLTPTITLASHQDPLLLSHLIDGFTKASHDTRQRAC